MKSSFIIKCQLVLRIIILVSLALSMMISRPIRAAGPLYVAPGGSDGNTCLVSALPCATIAGAVAKAASGDTIYIAIGTYTGNTTSAVIVINKGLVLSGGWDIDFASQTGMSTIDGQGARRGIDVKSGTITIENFVVQNGYDYWYAGGGIINYSGTLTINHSLVRNNRGGTGGGIENGGGTLTLNDTSVMNNTAGYSNSSGAGGGGGIENYNGTVTLNNSLVSSNTVLGGYDGNGIYNGRTLIINNSTISGNTGTYNAIFSDSVSTTIYLNSSTIANNQGEGLFLLGGTVYLQNTILADNTNFDCDGSSATAMISLGYNLMESQRDCTVNSSDQTNVDPHLGPLQDNGGPTHTQALLSGSPAINAGNPAGCSGNAGILAADQRGFPRVGRCDIGAFEMQFAVVTSVIRANPNPTSASTVNFTITFSKAVTGIDTISPFSDLYLTTTGITGASIVGVSGSGDTYTVTVNTGSGTGTLRLDVVDNDTILDMASKPLGGLGTGNGNFAFGEVYTMDRTAPTVLVYLPILSKPDPAIVDVYTFSNRCADFTIPYNGHDAVRITQCITRVRIRLDGQMYFDMNWSAQFLTNDFNYIYKNSDANNPNMNITDNLGNRYDHVATGGAAAQITYFYRVGGPSSADGWFLFPAARSGANVFTFHDDDEQLLIDNIALIH